MSSEFEDRYRQICPDFSAKAIELPALRVNTLKIDDCALVKRLEERKIKLEKIPYLKDGYWYEASFSVGSTSEYLQGYYYLQGVASQVVAEVLTPKSGELVLDMAAAPGGKCTHLAQLMKGKGTVIALDTDAQRLASLRNNCERLMVKNVVMVKKDARFAHELGMEFDRVLLDAPCSGNFCSEPGWFAKRNLADIKRNGEMQKELLKAAYVALKKGGTLVYSTCSLEPEEDELVIDWFLKKHDDIKLVDMKLKIGDPGITEWDGEEVTPGLKKTRRFWPHRTQTEGFYVAKMRKEN